MGLVTMRDRAKKIWLLVVDGITIIFLLAFHVSVIVVLGVALLPILLWKFLFGTKKEITRYTKEGLKDEGKDTGENQQ